MTGNTIGSYKIAEKLGSGGVGDVYRATDPLLQRSVAIKFLRSGLADRADVVERFHAEARTLAQLVHPNVAMLYCLLREGSHLGMVMEYVEGRTFTDLLEHAGRLPPERALPLIYQALDGIGHAHGAGVVHRDIKPANLMLATNGCVKVMDFGIARCVGADRATRDGHMVGTVQYMSPEQVRGGETDSRSDVYALGVLLYELLTGELPFDSENDYELCRAQIEQPPRPPRVLAPELPVALESVILRALAKDPAQRFSGVLELRESLEHASPRAERMRFASDRRAPPTRELSLEEAERIAMQRRHVFAPAGLAAAGMATAPTRLELRVEEPEASIAPAARKPRRDTLVAGICALALLALIFGVKVVRHTRRLEPAPVVEARAPKPARTAAIADPKAAPEPPPAEPKARAARKRAQPAKTAVAPEPSQSPEGESNWVIRRR